MTSIKQTYFPGTFEEPQMIWGVEQEPDNNRWRVLESYDYGVSWHVNCYLKTEADCDQFVEDWMMTYGTKETQHG